MQPSIYQTAILKAVQQRLSAQPKKGLIIEALAGCGKSTILWMIAQELKQAGFSAHEVVALVFGKKNQLDLKKKFEQKVERSWGASVRTIHSLDYTNNCSATSLNLTELEEKIRRGFNLTRDFYDCGKALLLIRNSQPPLYQPEFSTFEEYCLQRFHKSVRAVQYFMSAAVVVDNLIAAECEVIPTAESQVRAIATLPAHQQVEIWQKACNESDGVPIASKVREVKAAVLGEPVLERTMKFKPQPKLPHASTLLHHLKNRLKGTKVSLKDVEVLLELIQELSGGEDQT